MCKLLLMEKDEDLRMLYRFELEAWGYTVVDTGNSANVHQMIREETPDVVIMGAGFGKGNGSQLYQNIRKRYETLPVIVCFAYPHFRYESKSSISDLVFKGFDASELKDRIQMNLDGENVCAALFENAQCLWRNEWVAPGMDCLFDRRRWDADPVM